MADTGTQSTTTGESLESLSSTVEDTDPYLNPETRPHDWLARCLRRRTFPACDIPMSLKTPDTTIIFPPLSETPRKYRSPAAYRIGSSPRKRLMGCSKPATARRRTSSMQEGSQTQPPYTRPYSTRHIALSSSSISASTETLATALRSRKILKIRPPH